MNKLKHPSEATLPDLQFFLINEHKKLFCQQVKIGHEVNMLYCLNRIIDLEAALYQQGLITAEQLTV